MSFNPELFEDDNGKKLPLAYENEFFILEREKITFQCKTPEQIVFNGKGRIYCTTQRIIFVADKSSMKNGCSFDAFEIPLVKMSEEKFNQPIFGACSISGFVASSGDGEDIGKIVWKITFSNGGTGIVLPVFLRLLEKRKRREELDLDFVQNQKKAFVDPNDPTILYIAQPMKKSAV
ncbi:WW domain binding protein WBP-2, contains GRAM domain [Plasmopara halstedii]|uniref:WW domain binding protein WBP-2, contains GRAM domain n=1 Tax=Plasmopara halstedii TaxID=4781 RepID=A0A0P1A4G3_PLAHL|nr:WW domain binding protein WBP-2, contains GRAM domain [Plasmopara halstedii]CEG35111.1 WW domain binding protein WBP-2, contains GRAM domain [Plasmopara halstedii]|eukprot:XP_024571480.1 WW domain binding protein WBP-2, contains GRAM domain [Plasmopara halstedii]